MTIKEQIQEKINKRKDIYDKHEATWDESLGEFGEYSEPEPKEIDELAKEIKSDVKKHFDDLEVDFIIESWTMLGAAPCVMYDDNGMFAVSGAGFQPVVTGDELLEGTMTIAVTKEMWRKTIREALRVFIFKF